MADDDDLEEYDADDFEEDDDGIERTAVSVEVTGLSQVADVPENSQYND